MAITLDTTTSQHNANKIAGTLAHVVATGSNLILGVAILVGDANATNRVISSVTYNGVACTKAATADAGSFERAELWYLVNPATGTHNIIVNATGTIQTLDIGGISLQGAAQTGQPGTAGSVTQTAVEPGSIQLTTNTDQDWIVSASCSVDQGTQVVGTGQTTFINLSSGFNVASYKGPVSTGATKDTFNSTGASDSYDIVSMAIAPFVAVTFLPRLNLLGVG